MIKQLICIALIASAFTSCKKETVQGPEGPAGLAATTPTGSISGKVTQYDQYGNTYTSNLNTATVSLLNTNYSTVTDAAGNYTLTNIPAGIYSIATDKPGCGTYQTQQISFVGNGTLYHLTNTCDKPTYIFNSGLVKDSLNGGHKAYVTINLTANVHSTYALVIYGTTSNLSLSDPNSYYWSEYIVIPANFTSANNLLPYQLSTGIHFLKIYPINLSSGSNYTDIPTSKVHWVSYGTPISTSFSLNIP